jgi:hypothetical protein
MDMPSPVEILATNTENIALIAERLVAMEERENARDDALEYLLSIRQVDSRIEGVMRKFRGNRPPRSGAELALTWWYCQGSIHGFENEHLFEPVPQAAIDGVVQRTTPPPALPARQSRRNRWELHG